MKEFYEKEVKKDRLALELALVGFAGTLEEAMEAIVKPDTLEAKIEALNDLEFALDTIKDLRTSIEVSQERYTDYVRSTESKKPITDEEIANKERKESIGSLIITVEEVSK